MDDKKELKEMIRELKEIKQYIGVDIQLQKQILNEIRRLTWPASMGIKVAE